MKLWKLVTLCTVSLLILSGCTTSTPKPGDKAVVDSTLPVIELTKNGVFVDMNAVAFEWKNITDPRVKGIYVYKKVIAKQPQEDKQKKEEKEIDEYYDTVNNRFSTHYMDKNIEPDTQYSYYFKTFSDKAQSPSSHIITLNSLPVLQSVSWIHSIEGMPRSAKIIWRPHPNPKVKAYIIERKTLQEDKWEKLDTVEGRLNAEYIDNDLKDNYVYKYRIRVVTFDGIVSTPSEMVKVVTKALPNPITGLVATKDLPKVIKLNWDKSTNKDFYRYYLYRADKLDGSYEIIAKLHNNLFTDDIKEDGKSYFYRVSCVDEDGLESEHEKVSIQGMTLSKPNAPAIVEAKLVGSKIELSWSQVDSRTKDYVIIKKAKKGWFDTVTSEIDSIPNTKYVDTEIEPDTTYVYQVYAVDKNGIKSEPSIKIKIQSKEIEAQGAVGAVKNNENVSTPIGDTKQEDTQETIIPVDDFN